MAKEISPSTTGGLPSGSSAPSGLGAGGVPGPTPKAAVVRDRKHKLRESPKPDSVPAPPKAPAPRKIPAHRPRFCAADNEGWCLAKSRKHGMRRHVRPEAPLPEAPDNTCNREFEWSPASAPLRHLKRWATVGKSTLVGTTQGMAVVVFPYPSA